MDKKTKAYLEKIRHSVGSTIETFGLIEEGDTILISLSGGKDSLILTEILSVRRRYSPVNYSLVVAHIKVQNIPYLVDVEYLREFCKKLDVTFIYKEIAFEEDKQTESPCFFCAWSRRKELFQLAREYNCNKIATGHHADDAIETLFMNMAMHGKMSSLPACFPLFDGEMQFVRPLIQMFESDMLKYAEIQSYSKLKTPCPYDHVTRRKQFREIIDSIEAIHPHAKINLFNSMSNFIPEYLPIHLSLKKDVNTKFHLEKP
jgi:tRNA 2-thiocytidine biosynthesis protein TtcA